jgi:hypothetical protein
MRAISKAHDAIKTTARTQASTYKGLAVVNKESSLNVNIIQTAKKNTATGILESHLIGSVIPSSGQSSLPLQFVGATEPPGHVDLLGQVFERPAGQYLPDGQGSGNMILR